MSTATEMVELYIQAEKDALQGKYITLRGESMEVQSPEELRTNREYWERRVSRENGGNKPYSLASWG